MDVSTRVEGGEPSVILLTAKATMAAGTICLIPTIIEEGGNLRHCNLRDWYLAQGYELRPDAPFHLPEGGPAMWPMMRKPGVA